MSTGGGEDGNAWCEELGVARPTVEALAMRPDAGTFGLLVVALLERGGPMTLEEVAERFAEARVADRSAALLSLKRCRPARAPVWRRGDRYHLDLSDDELEHWIWRLDLRPMVPIAPALRLVPPPLPGPDVPLTEEELDLAWKGASITSWSSVRLTLAVLDAHGGPLSGAEVVERVSRRTRWHRLGPDAGRGWRRGLAVEVLEDGRWAIADGADEAVLKARAAVRQRIAAERERTATRPDPVVVERRRSERERERAARAAELERLSRALLVAFPPKEPEAVALLDVGAHTIETFVGDEVDALRARLPSYEVLGATGARDLLGALGFDPGTRRVAELGPPQKTLRLDRSGRTLRITTEMLVQGSCGIRRPFGDPKQLRGHLARGEWAKLRRRLATDVASLHALYAYGRLHGVLRLRWGFLDERIAAPWAYADEIRIDDMMKEAIEERLPLEVVVGKAPGWSDPWSRARRVRVLPAFGYGRPSLVDDAVGEFIDEADVQRARLPAD